MKQIIILLMSVLLLLAGGIFEIRYLNKTSTYLDSEMEYIENAVRNGNYEFARNQFDTTFNSWEKLKDTWNIFITHDEIDDINVYMIELKEELKYEEEQDCLISIEQIKSGIRHTVKRQNLRIDNIL